MNHETRTYADVISMVEAEGFAAFDHGVALDDNPYSRSEEEDLFDAWMEGWLMALADGR